MAIKEGDFIRLNFTGVVDGELFDTTDEERAKEEGIYDPAKSYEPITIRVGANHVIPGLDEALVGREPGEEGEVEIPPEKAYGPRDEKLIQSTAVKNFQDKPTIGTRVQFEGREGVVVNIIGKRAVIDFNHPLAGKTLTYTFTVEECVEGTVDRAKALIKLFSGRDMDVELDNAVLTINLPPGINYDRRWLMGRGMTVHQIFEYLDDVDEIIQRETFKRPKKKEPEEPGEEREVPSPAEDISEKPEE